MKYKVLFLDVDGTLINIEDTDTQFPTINQNVIRAVEKIKDRVYVALSTGRGAGAEADHIQKLLGIEGNYHILENGAIITGPNGTLERSLKFQRSEVKEILDKVGDLSSGVGYCVNGGWENPIEGVPNEEISIVSLYSSSKDLTNQLTKEIQEQLPRYETSICNHWERKGWDVIMINQKQASKGSGIQYVLNKIGISKEESVGIGDMSNDIPMFENVGLKIAMGNAMDSVKEQADFVTLSVQDAGVAHAIEKFF